MAFQGDSIYWVEVEKIVANPYQPRREFDESKLQELSESIRMYGVLQPLTVTRKEVQRDDGTFYTEYELIAGERRLRASKLGGIEQVPVIIREGEQNEQEKLELAIIENLQREDLNAVDRALAFKQLAEEFDMSHADVAKKVGRSREYVSNSIRLLVLPEHMLSSLKRAEMMEGHARTLLMLTDRPEEQEVVFKEILLKKLSVREVERIVRKIATDKVRKKNPGEFDSELIEMEKRFTESLGTRVQIQKTDFGGKLTIDYFSVDDLEAMLDRMKVEAAAEAAEVAESHAQLSANTPLDISDAAQAEPVQQTEGAETEVIPEPSESAEVSSAPAPEVAPETAAQAVTTPTRAVSADETKLVEPEPEPEPEPASEPVTPPQSKPSSSLSEALARAIGMAPAIPQQPSAASQHASSESITEPAAEPVAPTVDTEPAVTESPAAPNLTEDKADDKKPSDTTDDDSRLYSINNFTV